MLVERYKNSPRNSAITQKSRYEVTLYGTSELGKDAYILPSVKKSICLLDLWTDSLGFWPVTILRKQNLVVQHYQFLK